MRPRLHAVGPGAVVCVYLLACADTSSPPPPPVPIPGQLAFVSDRRLGQEDIYLMNADGSVQLLTASLGQDDWPAWSPDGRKIAFESAHGSSPDSINFDVFVMNVDGTGVTPLTADTAFDGQPAWSPDGTKIAFVSTRDGGYAHIFTMNATGDGVQQLTTGQWFDAQPAWSPDGTKIAFSSNRDFNDEIYVKIGRASCRERV